MGEGDAWTRWRSGLRGGGGEIGTKKLTKYFATANIYHRHQLKIIETSHNDYTVYTLIRVRAQALFVQAGELTITNRAIQKKEHGVTKDLRTPCILCPRPRLLFSVQVLRLSGPLHSEYIAGRSCPWPSGRCSWVQPLHVLLVSVA